MSGKKLGVVIGAVVLLLLGAYIGSPWWAARQLRAAALSGDVDRIEAAVDFPAVRESMRSQVTVKLTQSMENSPEMKDNPFSGLAAMMMPAIVSNMVDTYVTADGVSAMMKRGSVDKATNEKVKADPNISYSYAYRGLDRFAITATAPNSKEEGPKFVLDRRGLFSWKMVRIELPDAAFDGGKTAK